MNGAQFCTFLMLGVFLLFYLDHLDTRPSRGSDKVRVEVEYLDDPAHPLAEFRAWDRHLKFWGMSPIYTDDPLKVGPILLGPNDVGKLYLQYDYDDRGHLTLSTYRRGRKEM